MPKATKTKAKTIRELKTKDLDYRISWKPTGVKTSDDVDPCCGIIGQQRAVDAIRTGLNVKSEGYNIFVTGLTGTGRTTTIKRLLEQLDHDRPGLQDVCYANNFKNEDCPRVLIMNAGDGRRFKKDMSYLISSVRKAVPQIFLADDYKDKHSRITREFENRQKDLIRGFEDKLTQAGFVMVQVQSGIGVRNEIQPLIDDEPSSLDKLEQLSREGKFPLPRLDELRRLWDRLRREFDVTSTESKKLTNKLEVALEKLDSGAISPLVTDKVNLLKKRFPSDKVVAYLDEVQEALLSDLDRFREARPRRGEEEAPPYRKREPFEEFSINVVLDNSEAETVPIVIEMSPSYKNLFGSLERVVDRFGYWRTDFTRIFSGSILQASGGFLVMNAMDVLTEPGVWVHLKRAIRNNNIEITGYDPFFNMAGSGIKPEPIPLDVKVVLIGEPNIYHLLWRADDDFKKVFKIKAEFDSVMPFNKRNTHEYYRFTRRLVENEQLMPFDISGMQAVAEYGRRVAGRRDKLTTRFATISDIVREASFLASQRKASKASRDDVENAVKERRTRVNLVEDKIQEMIDTNSLMVSTTGKVVGQINGLSVYNIGDYAFGRPTRITVSTSMGKSGVINIEREADLSGPIHNKGVLVLGGYLRETFAQDKPLVMSASISFEQSYSGVDGDSASSTEIYAILSSLSGIPIRQDLAVTGSVNQKGEIQPIGGINEKVEGFYDVCSSRGLTGTQGCVIPHQNASDLLLRSDVLAAVAKGKFHIYPIKTIAQGIEILTDTAAGRRLASGRFTKGSVMATVDEKLYDMALALQNFGRVSNNDTAKAEKTRRTTKTESSSRKKRRRP
ncbi:MAG: AAA family ATPase [candidate division Zixibacteria bacterium]|nr:AAA family ATPase [candidate division Zixibacteria bacterium]MDH3937581.1 AAA family ATPase [candidate division Zixibacteria bacterium]MDH4035026.1 AAA family ATPase [candidate division Zixibacteria bacterium]